MAYNKRKLGTEYENKAVEYLKNLGMRIIVRNYRCKIGEIDIIAMDEDTLCFIEVKYRATASYGMPQEAVGKAKQRIISKVSDYFIMTNHIDYNQVRYDVFAILKDNIEYIKYAFNYIN